MIAIVQISSLRVIITTLCSQTNYIITPTKFIIY